MCYLGDMKFFALIFTLLPLVASAQVYRCTDANGNKLYQQAPCEGHVQGEKILDERSAEDQLRDQRNYDAAQERKFKQEVRDLEAERLRLERDAAQRELAQSAQNSTKSSESASFANPVACEKATRNLKIAAGGIYRNERERREAVRAAEGYADAACNTNRLQNRHEVELVEIENRPRWHWQRPLVPTMTQCSRGWCSDNLGRIYRQDNDGPAMLNPDGRSCIQTGTAMLCK